MSCPYVLNVRKTARDVAKALGTVIIPFRCRSCHRILGNPPRLLCHDCYRTLRSCDIPVFDLPGWTAGGRPCRAVSYYRGGSPLRVIHRAAKYRMDMRAARWLGQFLVRRLEEGRPQGRSCGWSMSSTGEPGTPQDTHRPICTSLPSHPARLRERGLDLTGILAQHVAGTWSLDCASDLLIRKRLGSPQNDLDRAERLKNVREVFDVSGKAPEGGVVILVDDVVTTGATLDAACSVLEASGWHVHLLALAFRRELFPTRSAE